ncbi:hypothetical protein [Paraburkholderia tropica]|uniref:hypothetical protein n=1 Tax=Paraburkholderia tropica TaxID=92647 RepID=UPI002AB62D73|nr:hypothetical protein [Paraburkholderia tropica]
MNRMHFLDRKPPIFDGPRTVFRASSESLPPVEPRVVPEVLAVPVFDGQPRIRRNAGNFDYAPEFIAHVHAAYLAGHSLRNIALAHGLGENVLRKFKPEGCPSQVRRAHGAPPSPVEVPKYSSSPRVGGSGPISGEFVKWARQQLRQNPRLRLSALATAHGLRGPSLIAAMNSIAVGNAKYLPAEAAPPAAPLAAQSIAQTVQVVPQSPVQSQTARPSYVADWSARMAAYAFTPMPDSVRRRRRPRRR